MPRLIEIQALPDAASARSAFQRELPVERLQLQIHTAARHTTSAAVRKKSQSTKKNSLDPSSLLIHGKGRAALCIPAGVPARKLACPLGRIMSSATAAPLRHQAYQALCHSVHTTCRVWRPDAPHPSRTTNHRSLRMVHASRPPSHHNTNSSCHLPRSTKGRAYTSMVSNVIPFSQIQHRHRCHTQCAGACCPQAAHPRLPSAWQE